MVPFPRNEAIARQLKWGQAALLSEQNFWSLMKPSRAGWCRHESQYEMMKCTARGEVVIVISCRASNLPTKSKPPAPAVCNAASPDGELIIVVDKEFCCCHDCGRARWALQRRPRCATELNAPEQSRAIQGGRCRKNFALDRARRHATVDFWKLRARRDIKEQLKTKGRVRDNQLRRCKPSR